MRRASVQRRLLAVGFFGYLAVVGASIVACEWGLLCNSTPSVELGCYWVGGEPARGDHVVACPPLEVAELGLQRGYLGAGPCPGGLQPLLKVLAAQAGDIVEVSAEGVEINGRLWPGSAPLHADAAGYPMPRLMAKRITLGADQVLLMSSGYRQGFDSRYFGPVSRASIVGAAAPLLTWR